MINRDEALILLRKYIRNEKMIFHCLASEAVMRGLAQHLGQDEEKWGLAGLLHDLDVEITNAEPTVHGSQTEEAVIRQSQIGCEADEGKDLCCFSQAGKYP